MARRTKQEFSPELPITVTPGNHPSLSDGATIVKVAAFEWIGDEAGHIFRWPWWVGAQFAVVYLFWRLMHERTFYEGIVRAWNRRLQPDTEPRRSDYFTSEQADEFIRRMEGKSEEDG